MAIKPLSELDDYDLVNSDQDCRGWTVMDEWNNRVGKVDEMLVDTDRELVTAIVLDSGRQIPARDFSLQNGMVIMRGETTVDPTAAATTTATTTTTTTATVAAPPAGQAQDGVAIPVIEEEIRIGKRVVGTGGVRVQTHVTERPVEETVTLREEHVNVERHPVNRPATQGDVAAVTGGVVEMTTMAEEAVVGKGARVVEEVVVSKDTIAHDETIRDTVRRTDVEIEDLSNSKTNRAKR